MGRRQFGLSTPALWALASAFVLMALWSGAAAAYFLFKDQLLANLISRQAEMQYQYEDRIAALRAQIERLGSRQLLDGEQLEQRVEQLARRQSALEAQAAALSSLPARPLLVEEAPRGDGYERRSATELGSSGPQTALHSRIKHKLAAIEASITRVEGRHHATLAAVAERYDASARRMRGVLADLGVALRDVAPDAGSALGGPFVAAAAVPAASPFAGQLARIHAARASIDVLSRTISSVPVRKPLAGELDVSSGFGSRQDPFLRIAALHSGVDFRAQPGEPVRATAAGTVTTAGWSGGYGLMVEIDHGNGLSTRYAHLSDVRVSEEQTVRPGQIIGRVGSTGRSTGPHLHYETRIDGEPVDPHRFLRAGLRLGAN